MVEITRAEIADVPAVHDLITFFADRDEMLHRPLNEIYENLRDFSVARLNGEVIGCVALHLLWRDLAEIKSLTVRQDRQAKGLAQPWFRPVSTRQGR